MNIATAKQQIKNAVTVYLQKDGKGQYKIPVVRQRPVFLAPNVPLDDLVQEFYLYLQADGWARLRRYDPSLPFDRWLSVVSYRFFKDFSLQMIDSRRQIPITNLEDQELLNAGTTQMTHIMMDIQQGLAQLEPPRDRAILTALLLRDEEPQTVADRFQVTVDNLYNIKRRALARLIQKHLKDYAN